MEAPSEWLPAPAAPRDAEAPPERVTAPGCESQECGRELGGPSGVIWGLFVGNSSLRAWGVQGRLCPQRLQGQEARWPPCVWLP